MSSGTRVNSTLSSLPQASPLPLGKRKSDECFKPPCQCRPAPAAQPWALFSLGASSLRSRTAQCHPVTSVHASSGDPGPKKKDAWWTGTNLPAVSVAFAVATLSVAAAAWGLGIDQKQKRPPAQITTQVASAQRGGETDGRNEGAVEASPLVLADEHVKVIRRWRDRWQDGRIGFHKDAVHPTLLRFSSELLAPNGDETGAANGRDMPVVLVPLCGKSVDIPWLAVCGNRVVGLELSGRAIEQLFEETRLPRTTTAIVSSTASEKKKEKKKGSSHHQEQKSAASVSRLHECGNIAVLEGDFFALSDVAAMAHMREGRGKDVEWWEKAVLGTNRPQRRVLGEKDGNVQEDTNLRPSLVDAVWDRGAMVAIEQSLRPVYANILASLLRPGGRILLVSVQYDNGEGLGPPYNLPLHEVVELFSAENMEVKVLESRGTAAEHLQRAGATSIAEVVCLITKN